MNDIQYKSIYFLLFAILNALITVIVILLKKENIQEYVKAYEDYANKSYDFHKQGNTPVVEKKLDNVDKVTNSIKLSPFCIKGKS